MPVHISAVLAELPFCRRCLDNTHICAFCESYVSHGYTICATCNYHLESEAA